MDVGGSYFEWIFFMNYDFYVFLQIPSDQILQSTRPEAGDLQAWRLQCSPGQCGETEKTIHAGKHPKQPNCISLNGSVRFFNGYIYGSGGTKLFTLGL